MATDRHHLLNPNTTSRSREEESDSWGNMLVQICFITGFVMTVVLGTVYGIHLMDRSTEEAHKFFKAMIIVSSLTMVVRAGLAGVLKVKDLLASSNRSSGSLTDVERSLGQSGGSSTHQTFFNDQMPGERPAGQELHTFPAGNRNYNGGSQTNETIERFFVEMAREKPIRFTREELQNFTHNFSQKLGAGGFGDVYKGEFSEVDIAVKLLRKNVDERVKEQFMAEVATIGRTNHINLVRLYGFCFDQSMKALVYECLENGSLDNFLFSEKNQSLDWEKLLNIAIGTAKGIGYLHEGCQQKIIHYDIKPGNVLLDNNWTPKVADFGLAKLCSRDNTHVTMSGARGTPGYAAPELWFPAPVTEKCDVYSYGMLLFEIVGRRKNMNINMSNESQEWFPRWVWKKHEQRNWDAILQKCGTEEQHKQKVKDVLLVAMWCVQYSPESRPAMSRVVKMLEGGMEVPSPPNPFHHLSTVAVPGITWLNESGSTDTASATSSSSSSSSSSKENDATPIMKKYEIEMAH